jgi:hypothetical protein
MAQIGCNGLLRMVKVFHFFWVVLKIVELVFILVARVSEVMGKFVGPPDQGDSRLIQRTINGTPLGFDGEDGALLITFSAQLRQQLTLAPIRHRLASQMEESGK